MKSVKPFNGRQTALCPSVCLASFPKILLLLSIGGRKTCHHHFLTPFIWSKMQGGRESERVSAAHTAARDNSSQGRINDHDQVLWREICSISSNTRDFDLPSEKCFQK